MMRWLVSAIRKVVFLVSNFQEKYLSTYIKFKILKYCFIYFDQIKEIFHFDRADLCVRSRGLLKKVCTYSVNTF